MQNPETPQPRKQDWIVFHKPSELQRFSPPVGYCLVGDHINLGSTCVIGGAPGVGKSRAALYLALCGATKEDWFGLHIRRAFRTMIIQNENSELRLSKDFAGLNCQSLDDSILVCPPPPNGMLFDRPEFVDELKHAATTFKPDVVILDPWNSVARDDKASDYLESYRKVTSAIRYEGISPTLVIVAHTRKPKDDQNASGRELLHLLSGSYVLASIPRCVFIMQAATSNPEDDRVIWTCCKNNDGEMGKPSIWHRRDGSFISAGQIDAVSLGKKRKKGITAADVESAINECRNCGGNGENGKSMEVERGMVVRILTGRGFGKSASYDALRADGEFKQHLRDDEGGLRWIA